MLLCTAVLTAAPASARADTYPLIGAGSAPLRNGILASDADISGQPIALAVRNDGVVAFEVEDRLFWVQRGRLQRIRLPLRGRPDVTLAFALDGTLLVGACPEFAPGTAAVFRAAPDIPVTVVAGTPGRRGTSGDGGPATAARLRCAASVSPEADGSVLIADSAARRIRRVGPDGIIHTVAGTGRRTIDGDGGSATSASLGFPTSVAALPGGGFAIAALGLRGTSATPAVRVVDAGGTITTRARVAATRIAAEPDGTLLLADWARRDGRVRRLSPDGRVSIAVDVATDRIGIPEFLRVVGDPFRSDDVQTDGAVPTADGGLLVAADFGIFYVAPAAPKLLAVALLPETRRVQRDLRAAVRLTRPARVTVEARRGRRIAATATLDLPAGDSVVPLGTVKAGIYTVRVVAQEGERVATAQAFVLGGGRLATRYARDFIAGELGLVETFSGDAPKLGDCSRATPTRVVCILRRGRRCVGTASLRLRRDGSLVIRAQRSGCRHRDSGPSLTNPTAATAPRWRR